MSRLEEQLKELQRRIQKAKLYQLIIQNLEAEKEDLEEFPGLLEEVSSDVIAFCKTRVESIENLGKGQETAKKVSPTPAPKENPQPQVTEEAAQEEPSDPLLFLKKYKHLEGKTIKVYTKDGDVLAKVHGAVAPFLKVVTETGYTISVKPSEIEEVS